MGYMGILFSISNATFYVLKGDYMFKRTADCVPESYTPSGLLLRNLN